MSKIASLGLALLLLAGTACAAGPDVRMMASPNNPLDVPSLQRGARNFVNYCLNCHSARFMRYNRLTDLGLTEQQIADNLILTGRFEVIPGVGTNYHPAKVGDTMHTPLPAETAKRWFGTIPPDLTVESRVRGTRWLYNYFHAFYRDEQSPTGWNNLVFPNVGMPHVLWQLGGVNNLVLREFPDHDAAEAALLATKGVAVLEPSAKGGYVVKSLAQETPGTMSSQAYDEFVADLVNYMDYMGEPFKLFRIRLGIVVLLFLGLLFAFAYLLKREYWKDVH
jgi:ubiquinol-cytochrome c reductase cytochrome c1 subunit